MVWLSRGHALTSILETRLGKQECLGKLWIPSNSQQFVWLEELQTVSRFNKIFDECTTAHNDSHGNRGFSPWQLLLGKTPTDKSVCENPDLAQCRCRRFGRSCETASQCEGSRTRRTSRRSCHFENVAKRFIKPDLGDIGQQMNGAGSGDLANTRVRE